MLKTHRRDKKILDALRALKLGGTPAEIAERISQTSESDWEISEQAVKRHLPGLLVMGRVEKFADIRDDRPVFSYKIAMRNPETQSV